MFLKKKTSSIFQLSLAQPKPFNHAPGHPVRPLVTGELTIDDKRRSTGQQPAFQGRTTAGGFGWLGLKNGRFGGWVLLVLLGAFV